MKGITTFIILVFLFEASIVSARPDSLFAMGREEAKTHQYTRALELFKQARFGYQKLNNYEYVAYCNANIAQVYENIDNPDAAFEHNQKAMALLIDIGKTEAVGKIWFNLGRVHFKQEKFSLSNQAFRNAIKLSDKLVQAMAYNWLGVNLRNLGRYDSSLYYHQKSIEINFELENQIDLARNLSNIGKVHYLKGEYQTAIEFYHQAESIQLQDGDTLSLVKVYNRLGEVYKDSGDPRNALVYLLMGQQINYTDGKEKLRNRELIADTRQLINSNIVEPLTNEDIKTEKSVGIAWILSSVLIALAIATGVVFRNRIFGL